MALTERAFDGEGSLNDRMLSDSTAHNLPKNTAPGVNPTAAVDGGLTAWLQCAAAFFLFFNSWGIVNTFGVYQTFYEQDVLRTKSSSDISWIGSLQAGLLMLGGMIAGPLFDYGYLRTLVITGSFLVVFGMMMTSLCTVYWQVILAQGLVIGLGNGCLFVPSVAILPTYFTAKKALAMGIAASGSSIGGILYPIIFHGLQPRIGFGWATRAIAFIMLATLMFPIVCMRMRVKPSAARRLFDVAAWREPAYVAYAFAMFFGFLGLYIPFFYIQLYSIQERIVGTSLAFYLLPMLNAASFFGRLIPNYIADKVGPLNVMTSCSLVAAILAFIWIRIQSTAGVVVFSILYGFFSGSFVSLSPTIVATVLCPHMGALGVRIGMLAIPTSIGLLLGNPIAGALLRHGWLGLQAFCGATVGLASLCMFFTRSIIVGADVRAKC